ncbi:MAG: MarR family transcriptional regulator [Candidatus Aureabacteria bacterium]|nr:MarR family transcriptional regulator [Candidatus Auribacterota bacterium]
MSFGNVKIPGGIKNKKHEALLNFIRAASIIGKRSQAFFNSFNVTEAQYNVMVILHLKSPLSQVEIAEHLVSSRASITSVLDRLENKGYICRDTDGKDRRVYKITLTSLGKKILKKIEPEYIKEIQNIMKNISESESRKFLGVLKKLDFSYKN